MELEQTKKLLSDAYWKKNDFSEEKIEKLVEGILSLLKWKFELEISWIYDNGSEKIFEFLKTKKRTCKMCVDQSGMYYVWIPRMDRDFFSKYFKELFFSSKYMYTFEDSEKIVETFEGGLNIKNK